MKTKLILPIVLLVLSWFAAACAGQDTTTEPGDATAVSTIATENIEPAATEDAGEAAPTSTGVAGEATSAPEDGTTGLTPTVATEDGTPAADAGGTAGIPQTGPGDAGLPDDLDEVVRVLRTAGINVDITDPVESDVLSAPGQIVLINSEEVEFYTYETAEQAEAQASLVANLDNPEREPQFYKMGSMVVRYVGNDTLVRDLLEDVLGAQAAGQ
jgi:hypothetical protein